MSLSGTLDVTVGSDAVGFEFTVENDGDEQVDMQFNSAQTFDVFVEADGETVWQYAAGRAFAQMLQFESLDPGETMTAETEWDAPSPGDYEARAVLAANDVDCEATATFSV